MEYQEITVTLIFVKGNDRRVASAKTPAQFATIPEVGQKIFVEDDPSKGGAPIEGTVQSIVMEFRKGPAALRQVYEITVQ